MLSTVPLSSENIKVLEPNDVTYEISSTVPLSSENIKVLKPN